MSDPSTKRCAKCQADKPRTEFYKNVNAKDGLQGWCKECTKAGDKVRAELRRKERAEQSRIERLARIAERAMGLQRPLPTRVDVIPKASQPEAERGPDQQPGSADTVKAFTLDLYLPMPFAKEAFPRTPVPQPPACAYCGQVHRFLYETVCPNAGQLLNRPPVHLLITERQYTHG